MNEKDKCIISLDDIKGAYTMKDARIMTGGDRYNNYYCLMNNQKALFVRDNTFVFPQLEKAYEAIKYEQFDISLERVENEGVEYVKIDEIIILGALKEHFRRISFQGNEITFDP